MVENVTVKEGAEYQIKARIKDNFDKDYLRGNIVITTDSKEQPKIEIMYFAGCRKLPELRQSAGQCCTAHDSCSAATTIAPATHPHDCAPRIPGLTY